MVRRVRDLMRRDFIRVSPGEPVLAVLQVMSMARVRAVPVLEGGRPRGLVAHLDLAAAILGLTGAAVEAADPVARFVRPVAPVSVEMPIDEAARHMIDAAVPCLLAVSEGREGGTVAGLLTEGDLLREAYLAEGARDRRAPPRDRRGSSG